MFWTTFFEFFCRPCTSLCLILPSSFNPLLDAHFFFVCLRCSCFFGVEVGKPLFLALVINFSSSQVALCLFPWRWEYKVVSLLVVTWHMAQVHSFWTSMKSGILFVVSLSFKSVKISVLFLLWTRVDSIGVSYKCSKLNRN